MPSGLCFHKLSTTTEYSVITCLERKDGQQPQRRLTEKVSCTSGKSRLSRNRSKGRDVTSLTSQIGVSPKVFERMRGYAFSTPNKSIEIVHSSNSSVAKDETSSHPPTSHRSKMLPTFGEAEAYFKIVIFPQKNQEKAEMITFIINYCEPAESHANANRQLILDTKHRKAPSLCPC